MSADSFLKIVSQRRSIYPLEAKSPVSDARIQEIIKEAILHVPSSFNSQSTRVVLLVKEEHNKFWEFVKEVIKSMIPAEQFEKSVVRLNGFQAGYGTVRPSLPHLVIYPSKVRTRRPLRLQITTILTALEKKLADISCLLFQILFYIDNAVTESFQKNIPLYAERFPQWATESNGMHQFALWTALEAEGFGANLQHYNPIVDAKAAAEWNIPASWALQAQLVIGTPLAPAGEKQFQKVEGERFFTYGA
jgi:predicted oxidoreductase (fatty acid repression mutant protein)